MADAISFRQRLTWFAHLLKAVTKNYHQESERFIRPLLPAEGVVFDVGAHAGQFAKLFSRLAPQGRVYAFEPSPYALSILKPMLAIKRLKNVTLVEAGLSTAEGSETLHIPIKKRGTLGFGLAHLGADVSGRSVRSYTINLTTMDKFVADRGITRLDFLKADIEGWELHMLKGGAESVARLRPSVLIEVSAEPLARANVTPADVFDYFKALDYQAFYTDEHAGYRTEPVAAFTVSGDYLFIPREKAALLPA